MQNSEKINVRQYDIYTLDKYLITFNSNIKYETYKCEWYYGIIFYVGEGRWDVIHNIYLGNRLLISEHPYWMKDIPFHEGTFSFLPKGIEVLTL